jgi:hypothetical protein
VWSKLNGVEIFQKNNNKRAKSPVPILRENSCCGSSANENSQASRIAHLLEKKKAIKTDAEPRD